MTTHNDIVENHYQGPDEQGVVAKIKEKIDQLSAPITTALLAPLDHFHAKGMAGTIELAQLLKVPRESMVLDAGSGLGGPARYLAETYGCQVTGVDLTPAYIEIARLLSERTGLSSRTTFQVGDILSLPFPDNHFDIIWTQHVVMNIRERVSPGVFRPRFTCHFFEGFSPTIPQVVQSGVLAHLSFQLFAEAEPSIKVVAHPNPPFLLSRLLRNFLSNVYLSRLEKDVTPQELEQLRQTNPSEQGYRQWRDHLSFVQADVLGKFPNVLKTENCRCFGILLGLADKLRGIF